MVDKPYCRLRGTRESGIYVTFSHLLYPYVYCRYGLCCSVWSENVGRVLRLGQEIHVGTYWANCWLVR